MFYLGDQQRAFANSDMLKPAAIAAAIHGGQAVLAEAREVLPVSWENFGEDLKEENT